MTMPTPQPILDGLHGLRLALYDEALAAGPRGLTALELRAGTAEEALRMGLQPEAFAEAERWLRDHGLLHEYQVGRLRARPREQWGSGNSELGNSERGTRNSERGTPAVAQLRTPVFAPRLRRDGQGAFF